MSDAQNAAPPAGATETQTSIQPPATAPAAPPIVDDEGEVIKLSPAALKARLDRQAASIAKRFGAESLEDLESRLKRLSDLEQSQLTEQQKLQARLKALEPLETETKELRGTLGAIAARELASLTAEQRTIVEELAGESPARVLQVIDKLRPTWKASPVAPPATTTPAQPAPAPNAGTTPNHLATWEQLQRSNPIEAANYFLRHSGAIIEARKQRA